MVFNLRWQDRYRLGSTGEFNASIRGKGAAEPCCADGRVVPIRCRPYLGRMLFTRIDLWIGKTLFVPPIIKLCQLTRQSQFAVSRLFWFIAALDGFYHADTLFSSILWGGMSIVMMITASQRADSPTISFMFFRLLGVLFLILDMAKGAATGEWAGTEFWIFVLVAEYAATIRTLPPREASKAAARAPAAR